MKYGFPIAAMALFALFCGPARAQEGEPLTLERSLAYVYNQNPSILSARYNLRATQESYPLAAAAWQPRVSAETNLTSTNIETGNFSEGNGATTKGASVSVEQSLFRGFRTTAEMDAARKRIEADTQALRQREQEIFVNTVEAYMNVIRDRLLLLLQQKNRALLSRERESVLARFEAGDITQTDVRQADARYSNAVADDAIAESRLQRSEALFEEVSGMPATSVFVMPEPVFAFPETIDNLVKQAALYNPRLSSLRSGQDAAEEDIRAAESDFYPQVTAFANHVKEYDPQPGIVDESETSTIGLRARISLYEGGATIARVRQAKARASQQFVQTVAAEQSIRAEIIAEWRRLHAFESEIKAREVEVVAAKYSAEGVREEARIGDRTVLDTLEAEQEVLDAESALVEARSERVVTAYRLAAALGMLTPETLGIPAGDPAVDIELYRDE